MALGTAGLALAREPLKYCLRYGRLCFCVAPTQREPLCMCAFWGPFLHAGVYFVRAFFGQLGHRPVLFPMPASRHCPPHAHAAG